MSAEAIAQIEKFAISNRFHQLLISESTPFDISKLYEQTSKLQTVEEILYVLKNFDTSVLFSSTSSDITFPCYFNRGNMAWFSESKGHVRYFSRSYNGSYFSYDTIDFLSFYYQTENILSIAKRLGEKVGIIFLDDYWKRAQIEKYSKNALNISDINSVSWNFPVTSRFFQNYNNILTLLNEIALSNLQNIRLSYHKDAMFFCSVRYLEERTGINKGHISRLLSFMTLVGLVEKVPEEFIPERYVEKTRAIAREKGWKRNIRYYTVKDWGKNLKHIETNLENALAAKINPSNISKKLLLATLGEAEMKKVYPDTNEEN